MHSRTNWRHDVKFFAAGAGCGLVGGALLLFVALSQFNLVRLPWKADSPNQVVATIEHDDHVDAPAAVLEPARERPAPTTGTATAPSPEAVIGPEPSRPGELADRNLLIPVEGVKAEQLSRQFSDERGNRRHEALDILAPRNTPVRAVEGGTIARLFFSKAGGITVYQFDPTSTFCYYYAHLERYADGLREGQTVKRGDVLGYVGTSGNAPKETPHLHFAIFRLTEAKHWWEGTPIDPYDVLR